MLYVGLTVDIWVYSLACEHHFLGSLRFGDCRFLAFSKSRQSSSIILKGFFVFLVSPAYTSRQTDLQTNGQADSGSTSTPLCTSVEVSTAILGFPVTCHMCLITSGVTCLTSGWPSGHAVLETVTEWTWLLPCSDLPMSLWWSPLTSSRFWLVAHLEVHTSE